MTFNKLYLLITIQQFKYIHLLTPDFLLFFFGVLSSSILFDNSESLNFSLYKNT